VIDREPPYVQIIEHFKQEISAGRLTAGDKLPAGREIARQFGVSLATAAKAGSGLQAMGPGEQARILAAEMVPAPQRVAAELGLEPLAQVICRRLAATKDGATAEHGRDPGVRHQARLAGRGRVQPPVRRRRHGDRVRGAHGAGRYARRLPVPVHGRRYITAAAAIRAPRRWRV
jgi:Bacterial regulatory proteins, gntR family